MVQCPSRPARPKVRIVCFLSSFHLLNGNLIDLKVLIDLICKQIGGLIGNAPFLKVVVVRTRCPDSLMLLKAPLQIMNSLLDAGYMQAIVRQYSCQKKLFFLFGMILLSTLHTKTHKTHVVSLVVLYSNENNYMCVVTIATPSPCHRHCSLH